MDMKEVSADDLQLLKDSLRIDGADDDQLLTTLVITARKNIIGQVGGGLPTFFDSNEEFNFATVLLASHYYRNRSASSDTQKYVTPLAFNDLILSMKEDYLVALSQESGSNDG